MLIVYRGGRVTGNFLDLTVNATLYHMDGESRWAESASSGHLICNSHVECEDVNYPGEGSLQELDCKSCAIKTMRPWRIYSGTFLRPEWHLLKP